jgi:PEP-CTERM motif
MNKHLIAGAVAALAVFNASALTTGDMMFTALNADEDGWAMVTFVDIAAGTKVYFSDNEWDGSAFNTGESYHQWDSGAAQINAGTVIRFSSIDNATGLASSVGALTRATVSGSTNYGLNQTEDSVYAYVASSVTAAPTFVAAITTTGFTGAATSGLLTGTGLSLGAGAIALGGGAEFDEYIGARAGQPTIASYQALVSDITNWTNNPVDGSYAANLPNLTAFTVAAVPEPETYALMVAGLAAVGTIVRRRQG